jgi:hypothetical protein
MFTKYESGENRAFTPREFDLATSSLKDILNDGVSTKDVQSSAPLKLTVITWKLSVSVYEINEFLKIWMDRFQNVNRLI